MPSKQHHTPRRPPTRIVRKPVRGQIPLSLDAAARRPRLAAVRRRKRLYIAASIVVLCVASFAGAAGLSHYSRFIIQDVSVIGNRHIEESSVVQSIRSELKAGGFHLFARDNIFLFPKEDLLNEVLVSFPRVKSVTIDRRSLLSQAIVVSLTERSQENTWCRSETECYAMDTTGYIYALTAVRVGYIFSGGLLIGDPVGQTFLRGRLEPILLLLAELSRIGYTPLTTTVENEHDLSVRTSAGFDIKMGFDQNVSDVIKNLQLLRNVPELQDHRDELEYIDLRFGSKVYYRMKNGDTTESE